MSIGVISGSLVGIPSGLISMWHGLIANIPSGWVICDGNNGTPDLRAKFVRGAPAATQPGGTGGEDTHTLVTAEMPVHLHTSGTIVAANESAHTHAGGTLAAANESAHTHHEKITGADAYYAGGGSVSHLPVSTSAANLTTLEITGAGSAHSHTISGTTAGGSAHGHTTSGSTDNQGSGGAHENRPAYYEILFIMKL